MRYSIRNLFIVIGMCSWIQSPLRSEPSPLTVSHIVAHGDDATCAVVGDTATGGILKCWGLNFFGTLGLEDQKSRGRFTNEMGNYLQAVSLGIRTEAGVQIVRKVKTAAVGQWHACAILEDNKLKCWGDNYYGQLGINNVTPRGNGTPTDAGMGSLPFVDLGVNRTANKVVTGRNFTCALLDNNSVKCWGNNAYGQLGLGNTDDQGGFLQSMGNLPTVSLGAGRTARDIAAGDWHACAILDNDTVKCWGYNTHGELGLGDNQNRGDEANEMGNNLPAVALGEGSVPVKIQANYQNTCVVFNDGSLKCWGWNQFGQLGQGHINNIGDGENEMANLQPIQVGALYSVENVAVAKQSTCALLMNDSNLRVVKCWGGNGYGELGLGDTDQRNAPVANVVDLGFDILPSSITAGPQHYCAMAPFEGVNRVKCWGSNFGGALGLGNTENRGDQAGEMGQNLPFVDLGTTYESGSPHPQIAAGAEFACMLNRNTPGHLKCWGDNEFGQLGLSNVNSMGLFVDTTGHFLPAINLAMTTDQSSEPLAIAAGMNHSCAVIPEGNNAVFGKIKCWGLNALGQLGQGTQAIKVGGGVNDMGANLRTVDLGFSPRGTPDPNSVPWNADEIFTGADFSCAGREKRLLCWGDNQFGQLGRARGTALNQDLARVGWSPAHMGQELILVNLGTSPPVNGVAQPKLYRELAVGGFHSCAIIANQGPNTLKCWGRNNRGQLGIGNLNSQGLMINTMGNNLAAVPFGSAGDVAYRPDSVAAGHEFTCALLSQEGITVKRVRCWGRNFFGQLGISNVQDKGGAANQTNDNALNVAFPQAFGNPESIHSGPMANHVCAISDTGHAICWGKNSFGQLGIESAIHRGDTPNTSVATTPLLNLGAGRSARSITCGFNFTCATLDNDTVKCWGDNARGNLGLGNVFNPNDWGWAANQMGNFLRALDFGSVIE